MTIDLMNLSNEKIKRLTKAAKSKGVEPIDEASISEYDWKKPKCFNSKELGGLNSSARNFATEIANKYSGFYNAGYEVSADPIDQFYVNDIIDRLDQSDGGNYFMCFYNDKKEPCGTVFMPLNTASYLAKQLLGGGDEQPQEETGKLSEFEESLLIDIVSIVISGLGGIHQNLCFDAGSEVIYDQLPFKPKDRAEAIEVPLTLNAAESEDKYQMGVMILCDQMTGVVERAKTEDKQLSQEEISKAIMSHLNNTMTEVTARFASIDLSIDEAMDLQVGDIILLNKNTEEPAELLLDGKVILEGKCAKFEDHFALIVTEMFDNE